MKEELLDTKRKVWYSEKKVKVGDRKLEVIHNKGNNESHGGEWDYWEKL